MWYFYFRIHSRDPFFQIIIFQRSFHFICGSITSLRGAERARASSKHMYVHKCTTTAGQHENTAAHTFHCRAVRRISRTTSRASFLFDWSCLLVEYYYLVPDLERHDLHVDFTAAFSLVLHVDISHDVRLLLLFCY